MGQREIDTLRAARENFVRKRREMAEQMVPPGALASHFAPAFVEIQSAIEALDRALADERALPEGSGRAEGAPTTTDQADGSNVERVDFQAINNP